MASERARPAASGLGWLRNKRVLLAEDNVTNQMVATQMLDALGAKVEIANDGAEAIEMLESRAYDLFLIDIEMPRVSGLDVIRTIRGAPAPLRDAPVIAVTAYALREHREKIAEAGADGLIPKPLLGIEQFGRDIITLADQSFRRGEAQEADDPDGAVGAGTPVAMSVFTALQEAIGPEAMTDLLGKIDGDLGRAEDDVRRGVASGGRDTLASASHVLISVAGAIGAQGLQTAAQRLNAATNGRGAGDIAVLSADIVTRIADLRRFVRDRMKASGP